MYLSPQERQFCEILREFPKTWQNTYSEPAASALRRSLFLSLVGHNDSYLQTLFAGNLPAPNTRWSLREAQGAVEGAEYTEAARGHPCGHIFKNGETTYRCRTCSNDDTCVLCAKCFEASDHEGHNVFVSLSPGNSGCCDCGDPEAWIREPECQIHSANAGPISNVQAGKAPAGSVLPPELVESIKMTVSRAMDYMCDVFSCSPEQLRLPKTEETVREDELKSRLPAKVYGASTTGEDDDDFALVLWNDEKHTVNDVRDQVSRACKISPHQALKKAIEIDDVGRSLVIKSKDLEWLLRAAKIIEQPKLTVTIRSARDTFREQMCATIIEWIADVAGCSVGPDHNILRDTICEQFLRPWRVGSEAHHSEVGKDGLDDHEVEDIPDDWFRFHGRYPAQATARFHRAWRDADNADARLDGPEDDDDNDDDDETGNVAGDEMDVDDAVWSASQEMEIDPFEGDGPLEQSEATLAGYPPPPPPPPHPRRRYPGVSLDSDEGESGGFMPMTVPKTPKVNTRSLRTPRPPKYWLEKPEMYRKQKDLPVAEDLERRVRLDYLILWDLRMWKQLRADLRDVLISTVVTLPHFKRLLGLRFSGVYTVLAELYLIADREPDHSIINLSLQMLTTPSITAEIVERGNFLSNLLAIMYTFLTTRQVGYPSDVNTSATLAFEQGAVTNRRTYHFYLDLKYLLGSTLVQGIVRSEERYLIQFLDLAKLHQGICPNVRAVGEHVEFENDAWLSASIIVQEIIKLCKLIGECFIVNTEDDFEDLSRAIRNTARIAITHSLGAERKRFDTSEIKHETRFKEMPMFEFEETSGIVAQHRVVDYIISAEPISFHHALHYTLSWLIDRAKAMSREQLTGLLLFSSQELNNGPPTPKTLLPQTQPDENLLALFDFPLRVLAWLAQMRAGMWVRNGITLRHQMGAYRGHPRRELSFFRDIFMLQTAMVVLPPAQVLASMIDRFDLTDWIQGNHSLRTGQDEQQKIDIAEDFVHLLIVLLSDRIHLQPLSVDPEPEITKAKRDITHTLCFKPLSFSSLCSHIPDKFSDTDQFDKLIQDMTIFRAPEGISDHGTFALKDEHYEEIDPYLAHFSRNQRDEAENIYKKHMAKKRGKDPAEIVYEPKLTKIEHGLFRELGNMVRTPLFAQIVFYLLQYTLVADRFAPNVPSTKVEQFLQFILHLVLVAVVEDPLDSAPTDASLPLADETPLTGKLDSFCRLALTKQAKHPIGNCDTIARLLRRIAADETFKSCEPKVQLILRHLRHKRPAEWTTWMRLEGLPDERSQNASPAPDLAADKELKKKQALERQAKVMAQFKQQQNSFMQNQAIDWGTEEFSDLEEEFSTPQEEEHKIWNYPSGTCILCQEETNEEKLYGTFALVNESRILRQTNTRDSDWVSEAMHTPASLDRSADELRPFGVAGNNIIKVTKKGADGGQMTLNRQVLAKGFPMRKCTTPGPVASGCGHIMHYSCFEVYVQATRRRQQAAIARNHPENLEHQEFLCPLCKALGNAFLPVIWKGKPITYPGVLAPEDDFSHFLQHTLMVQVSKLEKGPADDSELMSIQQRLETLLLDYGRQEMIGTISGNLQDLTKAIPSPPVASTSGSRSFNIHNLSMVFTSGDAEVVPASVLLAGMQGASTDAQSHGLASLPPNIAELVRIYSRLRDTMTTNKLSSDFSYPRKDAHDLTHCDTLANSLGYSITAAEIAQRGVESSFGSTLLDKIPSQTLTHLRVLSETVSSYCTIGSLRNQSNNAAAREYTESYFNQLLSLFVGYPNMISLEDLKSATPSRPTAKLLETLPLLAKDPFLFLSKCSAFLQPAMHLDIHHLMRMCYTAEIVRVIATFLLPRAKMPETATDGLDLPESAAGFVKLTDHIFQELQGLPAHLRGDVATSELNLPIYVGQMYKLAHAYALPFVRKCAILMHVRYGIEFPQDMAAMALGEESELVRLSHMLRLPSLDDIAIGALEPDMLNIVTGWLQHWVRIRRNETVPARVQALQIQLSHPAIFELVGLPKNFDTLQDEAIKRKCPKTGKDQTDPVVCLFCGEIFCSQAVCCKDQNEKGGCWQHRQVCGGPVGIFVNIRKCMVLLLNGDNGTWSYAPYLDKHGETDATLRRHHQLYLHQKRYDKLYRDMWLAHGVPSAIARRLEGESNNGGWETL